MNKENNFNWYLFQNKLRFFPYLTLGIVIFSLNSVTNINFFLKGYVVLLEAQIGIVLLYFLMGKLRKNKKITN
jgi:ABC-type bacteriocin/lantibiotic exporter with double-glycine peptidase domain